MKASKPKSLTNSRDIYELWEFLLCLCNLSYHKLKMKWLQAATAFYHLSSYLGEKVGSWNTTIPIAVTTFCNPHTIKARPFKMKRDKFGNWVLRSSQGMVSYRSVQCLGYLKVKWKVKDQWPEKNTRPSICFFVVIGIIYFSTKKKMGFGRNMGWVVNCMCQFFGTTDQLFSSILK